MNISLMAKFLATFSIAGLATGGIFLGGNSFSSHKNKNSDEKELISQEKLQESSIKTEYVYKREGKDSSVRYFCQTINEGQENDDDYLAEKTGQECEKLIKEILGDEEKKSFDVLLRTKKEGLKEELIKNSLLSEEDNGTFSVTPKSTWTVYGNLQCSSQIDLRNDKKVIILCNYSPQNNLIETEITNR